MNGVSLEKLKAKLLKYDPNRTAKFLSKGSYGITGPGNAEFYPIRWLQIIPT